MIKTILLPGTGKMALDIGIFLLRKRFKIIWLSRDIVRLNNFQKKAEKRILRLERGGLIDKDYTHPSFYTYDKKTIPSGDIIIESINENLKEKRDVLSRLKSCTSEATIIFSNSSSILPERIHKNCIGLHFFYPVELTNFAELIFSKNINEQRKKNVMDFIKSIGINHIAQNNINAFIANRILLPVQAESFRQKENNEDPLIIDTASSFDMLPVGQFSLMNSVGLETIYVSIKNYIKKMPRNVRKDYSIMKSNIKRILSKTDDGKIRLNTRSLTENDAARIDILKKTFTLIFINTCLNVIELSMLEEARLNFLLKNLFQIEKPIDEITREHATEENLEFIGDLYYKTSIRYFKPSKLWLPGRI